MKAPVGLLSQVKKLAQHSNSIFAICHSTICHSRYNDGQTMREIRDQLNEKGIKNLVGGAFTYTSTTTIAFKQKQDWLCLRFVSPVKPPLHGAAFYSCLLILGAPRPAWARQRGHTDGAPPAWRRPPRARCTSAAV